MPPAAETSTAPPTESRSAVRRWGGTVVSVVAVLLLALGVRTFVVEPFRVPSESMMPTLVGHSDGSGHDDRILVEKWSYWFGSPQRGDVVVFEDPGGWLAGGGHLVKRVIGVGGDHVVCCDAAGAVEVDGEPLDEPYARTGSRGARRPFDVTVPDGTLWLMGDNRGDSEDSRFHTDDPGDGFVPVDDVTGKVVAVLWPFDRLGGLGDG